MSASKVAPRPGRSRDGRRRVYLEHPSPRIGLRLGAALCIAVASGGANALELRPNMPVFGGGKFVDIFEGDANLTNASAHVAWAVAVPLVGQRFGGRKGLWIAGVTWMVLSLTQEAFFHAPRNPGPDYPSEVRADLLTRLVPTAGILVWDLVRGGARESAIDSPPEAPRWPGRTGSSFGGGLGAQAGPRECAPEAAAAREARLLMCLDEPSVAPAAQPADPAEQQRAPDAAQSSAAERRPALEPAAAIATAESP